MLETTLMLPILVMLFAGGFSISEQVNDAHVASISVDLATRYAAQLGNDSYAAGSVSGCQVTAPDPCSTDAEVIKTLVPLLNQMTAIQITEIDIYMPNTCTPADETGGLSASCPPDMSYTVGSNRADRYTTSPFSAVSCDATKGCYTLDKRNQTPPNETSIGIQVSYTYNSPTHLYSISSTVWASYRLDPLLS